MVDGETKPMEIHKRVNIETKVMLIGGVQNREDFDVH